MIKAAKTIHQSSNTIHESNSRIQLWTHNSVFMPLTQQTLILSMRDTTFDETSNHSIFLLAGAGHWLSNVFHSNCKTNIQTWHLTQILMCKPYLLKLQDLRFGPLASHKFLHRFRGKQYWSLGQNWCSSGVWRTVPKSTLLRASCI